MNKPLLIALVLLPLLGGCTSRAGCHGAACERADSDPRTLVIWWAPGMRGGLGSPEQPTDHTSVRLGE
jgi:hypothetical protein